MNWYKTTCMFVLTALCSACASISPAPAVDTNVNINFPSTEPITTAEQADAVLEAVTLSKAQIDWRYRQKEQICYTRFFVNHCLLEAKDERRQDLAIVKKTEVEANYFKRQDNVLQMDKALSERNLANPLPDPDGKAATDPKAAPEPEPPVNPELQIDK